MTRTKSPVPEDPVVIKGLLCQLPLGKVFVPPAQACDDVSAARPRNWSPEFGTFHELCWVPEAESSDIRNPPPYWSMLVRSKKPVELVPL